MQNPLGVNMAYLNHISEAMNMIGDPSNVDREAEANAEVSDLADKYYPEKFQSMMSDAESIREAIIEMSNEEVMQLLKHDDIRKHCEYYFHPIAIEASIKKANVNYSIDDLVRKLR